MIRVVGRREHEHHPNTDRRFLVVLFAVLPSAGFLVEVSPSVVGVVPSCMDHSEPLQTPDPAAAEADAVIRVGVLGVFVCVCCAWVLVPKIGSPFLGNEDPVSTISRSGALL